LKIDHFNFKALKSVPKRETRGFEGDALCRT